ncbi:N-acetylglucosamine-6-phosphate deacetylase [Lacticigenium naphthae]|uniref:N-acetylglucosamine-6-phosphate deacetylase n=1 Tax=Lacticigenium naphthae TaxID=515351 RepID=UPI00041B7506|nr:N-acetylglucosamine-6-phosphate deacetylase [Lacticigenium naphthae]
MARLITNKTIFTGIEKIENGYIRFDDKIVALGTMEDFVKHSDDEEISSTATSIVPGFIDVHSHGGYGIDSMDGDPKKINEMIQKMFQEGITSYFPTTMTQSSEAIEKALAGIREAAQTNPVIQGIHLEGPYISPVHKGAQSEQFIKVADAEQMKKWVETSGGLIRLVTYAPETGDVSDFENYCQNNNIVLSVGHSDAKRELLKDSKVSHVTHLYNAQRGLHHREPGVTGHGLLENSVTVEMIVDGFHIDPDMVRLAYLAKGADGIELITDSMRAKGLIEGESELGGQKVIVKNKQARLENGVLAGSVLEFSDAFKNMIKFTGCSVEEAVKMSSVNQAKEFSLIQKGTLEIGKDADLVLMDSLFTVLETISLGKRVFDRSNLKGDER